jgi:medium-chain acyl-[acyl-carrier-protein] hydrolase
VGEPDLWVRCTSPRPTARLRLFCFPYAGGGASIFREWPALLPGTVEVHAVQLPGRENRLLEPPMTQMPPLVSAAAAALSPHLDRPFAFFGHSMGALVSFELARQLRRDHASLPRHIVVSGRRAPHLPESDPPISQLPQAEFIDRLRNLNGTPRAVLENEELLEIVVPTVRADFAVCESHVYTPEPPLPLPISAFGGDDDAEADRAELEAWQLHTTGTVNVAMFPGDHFFIQSSRASVMERLAARLNEVVDALPDIS